ncbi:MAG: hypothetical protein JST42_30125 [Bacteroidetes bacterium]|nr:hypothetical protein [Bacteroidota bacterium]
MNKNQLSLFFVVVTCVLLGLQFCPPFDLQTDDKDVFRYAGMLMMKGKVPYRDLFDHKPPLIFILNFAGLALGSWGLWLLDMGLALMTTVAFFHSCRRQGLPFPWLLPLLFNLMIRDFLVLPGIGMTREYTCFFQLLFFCVLLGAHRWRHFLLGGLTALTFFMQQDQVLFLAPFLVYALLRSEPMPALQRIIPMGVGFISVTLPIIGYLAIHGALRLFWDDAFLFNFTVYTAEKQSLGTLFRNLKDKIDGGNFELPFLIATVLGLFSLLLPNKRKGLLLSAVAGLLLSVAQQYMNVQAVAEGFIYYIAPLSAGVCCVLFAVCAFAEEPVLAHPKAQLVYGVLLCSSLTYTALQHFSHLRRLQADSSPIAGYLRQHAPGDYQVYAFGNSDDIHIYNDLHVLAPSKWIYHHFWKWYPRWDTGNIILRSIGDDLLRHKTTYLITDSVEISRFLHPSGRDWWMSFTRARYEPVTQPDSSGKMLWHLKKNSQ